MFFQSLASSSNGNCYVLSDGFSVIILEAGVPINFIREAVDLAHVNGVLITHEHQDHSKYAKDLLPYSSIYASKGTLESINNIKKSYKTVEVKPGIPFTINTFIITAFNSEHDAKEPLYFYIYSKITKETFLFATDTYYIRNRFKRLDYIAIECNYQKEILQRNMNSGKLPKVVASRLLKSHFELSNVLDFLKANSLKETKQIYLLHLSDGNSDEKLFKELVQKATGVPTEVCPRNTRKDYKIYGE